MIKLTLLIYVCCILSTGYFQEITNSLSPPNSSNNNTGSQLWPLQSYQGQGQRRRVKPCPRRNNRNDAEEPWIPSYSSRITHPVLQPQALKNEEVKPPISDITFENNPQSPPNRRVLDPRYIGLSEEDCIDQLELANEASLKTSKAEETTLRIIKDCIEKKQALGSRRSMPDSYDSNVLENDNNYPRDWASDDSNLLDGNSNNYPLSPDPDTSTSRDISSQNNIGDRYAHKLTTKLIDPEKGTGIAGKRENDNIPKNARICYACSTATNPSCWEPDQRTTVKYCSKEQSCVTKSFGLKNSLTIIRDCGKTCDDSSVPGIEPKYKSCKLCHKDFCNSAISINGYNLAIILVISIIKCTF